MKVLDFCVVFYLVVYVLSCDLFLKILLCEVYYECFVFVLLLV